MTGEVTIARSPRVQEPGEPDCENIETQYASDLTAIESKLICRIQVLASSRILAGGSGVVRSRV